MNRKPYSEYKESGVQWLGQVPGHWKVMRLKMTAHLNDRKVEADEENPVPYIGMENIESWTGKLLHIDPDVVPSGAANQFTMKSTLFGKLRPYLAKACNPGFDGLCSTELLVIESENFDRRALLYWLLADGFIKLVDSSTYGSKMPRASWDFIGNCLLPVPPLPEQTAIVDFLDRETGRIDTLVAKKRRLIALMGEKRTALISRTVTRGLPADAAREFGLEPHTRFKDSGIEWLGEVPEGWEPTRLKFIADIQTGFAFSSDDFTDEGIPVLRIGDITKDGSVDFSNAKYLPENYKTAYSKVLITRGAIVMAMTGATIGKAGKYDHDAPALLNQRVCSFYSTGDNDQNFLWYILNADFYLEHINLTAFGGAQPNISDTELLDCFVATVPATEQTAIATYLDRETAKIDQLVTKVEAAIARLQEYRTALITAAVTGKIDVREEMA